MTSDDEFLEKLGKALGHDPERIPPPERVAALRAAAERMRARPSQDSDGGRHEDRRWRGRRAVLTGGIAAGVGGVAGYLVRYVADDDPEPGEAAPVEDITFQGDPQVDRAGLINHTWGTELLLDVRGLEPGTPYDVIYRTLSGEVGAGSLLAVADTLMKCRFNAAPLRADMLGILVRDPDGSDVLNADLPAAPT